MNISTRLLTTLAFLVSLMIGQAAHAATVIGTLEADAGTYTPVALGDDVTLSACGSIFDGVVPDIDYSLCDAATVGDIAFSWTVTNLTTFASDVFSGSEVVLSSGGIGDLFDVAGSYFIDLSVSALINPISLTGGDFGLLLGGVTTDTASAVFEVTASVPEPAAALLLLPALVYIGRRQRRKAKASVAV